MKMPPCKACFVMPFGKYKGMTLDQIADENPSYVVWLADENVLKIEPKFLEATRLDDMENDEEFWEAMREDLS